MNTNCNDQTVHLHLLFPAKIDLQIKWLVSNSKRWDSNSNERVSASGAMVTKDSDTSASYQNMSKELL